jgi:hypothetical protein
VYAAAVWGDRLFIGGKFDTVDGVAAKNVAEIDIDPASPTYGELIPAFKPRPAGTVWAMAADATHLYIGGRFTKASGQVRGNVVRYAIAGDGTLTLDAGWAPATDGTTVEGGRVRDIMIDPDRPGSAYLVGHFYTITDENGTFALRNVARIGNDGNVDTSFSPPQSAFGDSNWGMAGSVPPGLGRVILGTGGSDWVASFSSTTGALQWKTDLSGQAQDVTFLEGTVVVAGHYTYAAFKPGYLNCYSNPDPAFCASRLRLAAFDPASGWLDLEWAPDATGSYNGPWVAVATDDGHHVWTGGEFKFLEGVQHSFIGRFSDA